MSLKSSIRQTERSIAQRRGRISTDFDGITETVRKRMVSPGALVTAGLFGAFLHRDNRFLGVRMMTLLETAKTGLRLLTTLSSPTAPPTGMH